MEETESNPPGSQTKDLPEVGESVVDPAPEGANKTQNRIPQSSKKKT